MVIFAEKDIIKQGYKLISKNSDYFFYIKFGIVDIYLKIFKNDKWNIEHNKKFPEINLINKKIIEFVNEEQYNFSNTSFKFNKNIKLNASILKRITNWIKKCTIEKIDQQNENINNQVVEEEKITPFDKMNIPDIDHNIKRQLTIYVWGRSVRKFPQNLKLDHNFNACVLHGKKSGVDWRKDGRTEEIRKAVMKGRLFPSFMYTMVKTVEIKNVTNIGINCSKGRHRSVTCAIILHKYYYPLAKIIFMELR